VSSPDTARERRISNTLIATLTLLTFAVAQLVNVFMSVMARRSGNDIPIGGKEGWYWYAMAPIIAALVIGPVTRNWPRMSIAVLGWLLLWDVIIHESALFHDYAGATSPLAPTFLFRWGPLHSPFTAMLDGIGVGPFSSGLILLRLVSLIALAMLAWSLYSGTRSSAASAE
jgi:hypothetical protein